MARKPLKDRVSAQARRDARLKYEPQRRQLSDAQQQVADQFAQAARAETASSRGIAASIDEVKPKVRGYIGEAQGVSSQASQDLQTYLNGSVLQGAAARDSAGTRRRLAETLANTTTELDQRKVDAAAGAKYTIGSLRASAGKQLEKIGGQLSDLASDEGTYASSQADRLRQAAAQRAVTRRGQDLSHRDRVADRESRESIAATKKAAADAKKNQRRLPGGAKPATPAVQNKAQDKIEAARSYAARLKKFGRPAVGNTLKAGDKDAGVPSFANDPIYLTAALDMEFDGHLSAETVRKLHARGISIKKLGYKTRSDMPKRPSVSAGLVGLGDAIRGN